MCRGKVITFSGFDGAGKSTNCEILAKTLCKSKGYISLLDVVKSEELINCTQLNELYEIFCEKDVVITRFYMRSHRTAELQNSIMYASDDIFRKKDLIKELTISAKKDAFIWRTKVINPLLNKGIHVIFDRYFYDEIAYRSLYSINKKWIEDLYKMYPKPDLSFYLKLNIDDVINRNKEREDIQTTLFKNKLKMVELFENWEIITRKYGLYEIDASKNIEIISKKILDVWEKLVNK